MILLIIIVSLACIVSAISLILSISVGYFDSAKYYFNYYYTEEAKESVEHDKKEIKDKYINEMKRKGILRAS